MTRDLAEVLMRRYPIIRAVDAAVVRNSLRVMVLMRLNFLMPFGVLNYVFGISGVDWVAFLLAMVGTLPRTLLLVVVGAGAGSVYHEGDVGQDTTVGVVLISTGIAFGIIGLAITWNFAKDELQKVRNVPLPKCLRRREWVVASLASVDARLKMHAFFLQHSSVHRRWTQLRRRIARQMEM